MRDPEEENGKVDTFDGEAEDAESWEFAEDDDLWKIPLGLQAHH
jgi:hypothetical protein